MRYLMILAILVSSAVSAQTQTCYVSGNVVQCQGDMVSRGTGSYVNPGADLAQQIAAQQAAQAAAWRAAQLRDQCLKDDRVIDKSVCYQIQ